MTDSVGQQLVIVGDAHLGAVPDEVETAMLAFLEQVPELGDALLVNGDLFDFWFAWRRAIPRSGFRIASALAHLARRVPVLMTGGNHDRWGDSFWDRDAKVRFGSEGLRFQLGGSAVLALHGDGIAEQHWSARLMHRLTRHPITIAGFRSLPPDFGFWLVDRLSGRLADSTREGEVLDRAARAQRAWAELRLRNDPSIALLVMGHTHRVALSEPFPGRRYLNPGAWLDGLRYAVATEAGVELRQFH
ncbi:MAG TPA: metallophosphoesterase [Gemmatimonadales bacterium]